MENTWSNEEMIKLIELWSEGSIQAQLEGSKRNPSRDMEAAGFGNPLLYFNTREIIIYTRNK